MSGVVLRCSICGTTQSHPGECEACLEGKVGYFCGNHSPGVWINVPTCKLCGARFGQNPSSQPVLPSLVAPRLPARVTDRPVFRRPTVRRVEPSDPEPSKTPRVADREDIPAAPLLMDLLAHIDTERSRRAPPAEAPRERSFPVWGCLRWLLILVLVFIALAFGLVRSCLLHAAH